MLGRCLKGGEVIELRSDLGGGKTTFVNGLAKGAGSSDRVSSPTFTLSRIYKAKGFDIYHFDFYRLENPGVLRDQLAEAVQDNNVVIVEWAGIVKDVLPEQKLTVEFRPAAVSSEERAIIFNYPESYRRQISFAESNYQDTRP